MVAGNAVSKEAADLLPICPFGLSRPAGRVIDSTDVSGEAPLEFVRILADIVQEAARFSREPGVEPAAEASCQRARSTEMPLETLPSCDRLAGTAMRVKATVGIRRHRAIEANVRWQNAVSDYRPDPRRSSNGLSVID
jgi:hypothetical protein